MIKDMIVKLMEEATEESEHKGWCDTEMGTNKQTREDKADAVSTLTAESEELDAKISKLGDEIAELSDAIAEIDAAVAEATALRTKEKAKNEVTIEEAKVAQVAVAKALTVLQEFYAGAAQATAFVQQDPAWAARTRASSACSRSSRVTSHASRRRPPRRSPRLTRSTRGSRTIRRRTRP